MARANTKQTATNAAGVRTVKHGASRLLVYVPPWAAWLALPAVALIAHLVWGRDPQAAPWFSMLTFALVAGLVAFTWNALAARSDLLRWLASASAAAAGLWLIVAALIGPMTRVVVDVWGWAGFFVCLFWSVRRAAMGSDEPAGDADSRLAKVLAGARVTKPRQIEGRVVANVEVNRGEQTVADLQKQIDNLEAALAVRPGAARLTRHPDDAGRAELTIVPTDPLAQPTTWPGPSAPGTSVASSRIGIGVYEDALPAGLWLPGDDATARALGHWLFGGVKGSGKSQAGCVLMTDALTRTDVVGWGSDPAKAWQTFGPLMQHMDWVATDRATARDMVAALNNIVKARAEHLGRRGIKQWEPDCGIPLLVAWFEEAAEIVESSEAFTRLVERARSTGVVIVVAVQRPSHSNIDTDTRSQLTAYMCFGMRDSQDAAFVLADEAIDAGAQPELWSDRAPGYAYLAGPGIPGDRLAVPLRTYRASDEQLQATLEQWRHVRADLDDLSAAAAGKAYEQRTLPAAQPAAGAIAPSPEAVGMDWPDDEDGEDGLEPMPAQIDSHIQVDPDVPVGPAPVDMAFGAPPGRKLSTEQARAVVQQHLRTLLDAGKMYTQPRDICEMKPETTRTREWVRQELIRLCQHARPDEIGLERDAGDEPGVYRIVALAAAEVRSR